MNNKMKRIFYSLVVFMVFLTAPQISNAQITLEHTFDSYVSFANQATVIVNPNLYMSFMPTNNQVKIYNPDYSLFKSIAVSAADGYQLTSVLLLTKNIFSANNKLMFFVQFTSITNDFNSYQKLVLYDEDGVVIKDFGFDYLFVPTVYKVNNKFRLSLVRYVYSAPLTYKTEVYSLPGNGTL